MADEELTDGAEDTKPDDEQVDPEVEEPDYFREAARMYRDTWEKHRAALHNEGEFWAERRGPRWAKFHKEHMVRSAALALENRGIADGDDLLIYAADLIRINYRRYLFRQPFTKLDAIAEFNAFSILAEEKFFGNKKIKHIILAEQELGMNRSAFEKARKVHHSDKIVEKWRQNLLPYDQEDRLAMAISHLRQLGRRHRQTAKGGK